MVNDMNFEIGKVVEYSNKEGKILTKEGQKYLFLEKDLKTDINIKDLVIFRPELVNDVNRAYFVRNLNKYLNNSNNKNNVKRYLKSKNYEV